MNNGGSVDPIAVLMLTGIWAVVVIAFYVWYLWALSRLFPRIGLPSSHGWIPVWNQWQLVARAGLPGWLVLFGFVPGLGLIALVVMIIAIYRINQEYGKGAGLTVLGAIIPQVWAMLLTSHIDQTGHGVVRQGSTAAPTYVPPGYAGTTAQHQQAPYAQAPQSVQAPQAPYTPQPQAQAFVPQPAAPQPAASQSHVDALFGAPAPRHDLPPVPPQPQSAAPAADPSAVDSGAVRITPVPPAPASGAAPSAAAPQPGQPSAWGFSNTTEDAFERLAAQGAGPQAETPLGYVEPPRPFSWPEQHAPVVQESVVQEPVVQEPVLPAAPPTVPAPPVVPAPPAPSPVEQLVAADTAAPQAPDTPEAPEAPQAPAIPEAPQAHEVPEAAETPAAQPAVAAAAPAVAASFDEEDDRTIVVPRSKRWGLELPSGDIEELVGDDVVIGRRPEGPAGVTLLKIADPTRTLSKSHVRMRRVGDEWTVEDLQSTNGVSIDGDSGVEIIEAGREVQATDHMIIGTLEVRLREIS